MAAVAARDVEEMHVVHAEPDITRENGICGLAAEFLGVALSWPGRPKNRQSIALNDRLLVDEVRQTRATGIRSCPAPVSEPWQPGVPGWAQLVSEDVDLLLRRSVDPAVVDDSALPNTGGLLQEVSRSITTLLAAAPMRPGRISVQAGSVVIEIEWPPASVDGNGQTRSSAPSPAVHQAVNGTSVVATPQPAHDSDEFFGVRAPMIGTFYHAPEPGVRPFVSVGDVVRPGQQVGILEAMKMMLPIEASRAGRVAEFLVENGTAVEFDTPLISLTVV